MVNIDDFIERLEQLLRYYNLSAAAFADKIGVQRSSISHLLSGRNKPSLDFVLKVVNTFNDVNLYWLLNGKGAFPSEPQTENFPSAKSNVQSNTPMPDSKNKSKSIEKIIIFYTDGSFKAYDDA